MRLIDDFVHRDFAVAGGPNIGQLVHSQWIIDTLLQSCRDDIVYKQLKIHFFMAQLLDFLNSPLLRTMNIARSQFEPVIAMQDRRTESIASTKTLATLSGLVIPDTLAYAKEDTGRSFL